ncbi:tropinone reductaseAt1g07440 [Dorcoceras hygrometricum]|uniref:Tropinone reductaseAt1g07440 n=1 Tax=Dorcoceras hygrometricum TaxID=472368 RepID=A0A2Z7AP88_9LAMI|nr:tropinone reductaseAt1g07440 [Dorcoceras hygrometricum]
MVASFFVNAMQVDFVSVLAMEHTRMGAVTEFFANVKVITGTVVSFVANRKLVVTKDIFAEAFGLPTEGLVGFLDIPTESDIVAKALCAKAGSFYVVTSENFDLMVAISAGLKVVKLHPQKVLNNKLVHTYMKKNLNVGPAGETSKVSGATANEQKSTADSVPSLTKKQEQDAGEMKKLEKAAVEKPKKKKEKVVQMVKKKKVVVQQTVEARSQAAPAKSKFGTSSDTDLRPLVKLKKGG